MVGTTQNKAEGLLDEATGRVKDAVGGATGDLGKQVDGKIDQAAGKARQEFSDLYDANEGAVEAATCFVRERPLVSLLIASLVGLVIGRLVLKRCKS